MATAYTPLAKRKENPLAPEHFPAFGTQTPQTPVSPKQSQPTFLERIKAAEEERRRQQEDALYDPSKLGTLSHAQLEREGWAILSVPMSKERVVRWNSACASERLED